MNHCLIAARWVALSILLAFAPVALADIGVVKRSEKDFSNYPMSPTRNVRVTSARVAIVNYELIAKDFPQMARSESEGDDAWRSRVDRWLIDQTAFVLDKQAAQTATNSRIPTDGEEKQALRPRSYGRAHIIPVEGGLMDAKGVGSASPRLGGHSDGLATLGEMIREYIYEKVVSMVLEHAGGQIKTVGDYGVIYYGFNVKHEDGSQSPAGFILRQAHQRAAGPNSSLGREEEVRVEQILRRYGLTSSGETFAFRETPHAQRYQWDYTNVQGTNNPAATELVDFGAYLAVAHFDLDLMSNYDLGQPVAEPGQVGFVQPDPTLRVPLEQWGAYGNHQDPKQDKPFVWSHELARAFGEGQADRAAVNAHLHNMLSPIAQRLFGHP